MFFIFVCYTFFVIFEIPSPARRAIAKSATINISSGQVFGSCFGFSTTTGGAETSFFPEVKSTHSLCSVSSTVISQLSIIL